MPPYSPRTSNTGASTLCGCTTPRMGLVARYMPVRNRSPRCLSPTALTASSALSASSEHVGPARRSPGLAVVPSLRGETGEHVGGESAPAQILDAPGHVRLDPP